MNKTVETIKLIMREICISSAMVHYYVNWKNETKIEEIDNSFNLKHDGKKFQFNPNDLTKEELIEVGFRLWDDETNLMLVPLYLHPYIYPNLVCESINGNERLISDVDLDVRFGCIAYGFYPKNHEED